VNAALSELRVGQHVMQIDLNKQRIQTNAQRIETNQARIDTNAERIEQLEAEVATLRYLLIGLLRGQPA
jgi:2-polyprenyl-3-methyl-5-hydroxy-6-metoxy-1,4-benzoquinol methylase